MASQTAIEYGTDRVRLLEFDGSGHKVRVLQIVDVSLAEPAGGDEDVSAEDLAAESIADAADKAKMTSDPSGMSFDAGHALFREFSLPFTSNEQIEKVVRFEAESHIPLNIEDVVMQHMVLRKSGEKSHLLAAVINKDDLLDRFDVLDEAGMDPHFVELDVFALLNAVVATGVADDHERFVLVDARDRSTNLLFIEGGKLFSVRSLRMGAHGVPREGDASHDEVSTARARDYLGRLQREVRRTLATLSGFADFETVLVSGSGSLIPGFLEAMTESFGGTVDRLDLLSRVDHKLNEDDAERYGPDIGVALGVAFKLNGVDVTNLDFRQEECAYTKKFDQVKSPFIVLSFVVFLIVSLMAIDSFYRVHKIETEYGRILVDAREQLLLEVGDLAESEAVWNGQPEGPLQMQAIFQAFQNRYNEMSLKLGRSSQIPSQASALGVWMEFSNLLRDHEEELGQLWVRKIDISTTNREKTLKFSCRMKEAELFEKLRILLSDDPLFVDLEIGKISNSEDGFVDVGDTVVHLNLDELERRREG
ncbi:MAG: Tfp pilus assembly PilM family ATPase [Pseudohongiellaceae bacterium]|jgi:Tfp pilus assembly PilM family ATPase